MKVRRFDSGSLNSPTKLPNGFLRADAYLTRVGVFVYRRADGSTFREYRPTEEVFRRDSLDSLCQVPLTLEHPTDGDGLLNATNAKEHTVGSVGYGRPDWDSGVYVQGPVMITDAAAVSAVESGKTELSCGYTCVVEMTPGEYLGQPYDGVQRGIIYNHVAIVGSGRAGAEVKIKMDAADAVLIRQEQPKERTVKIRLDGIEVEVTDSTGQLIEKERATREAKLHAAESDSAKANARADAAEAKVKELSDPKALLAKVNARATLLSQARDVVGTETKLDELDDRAIRLAVLALARPEVKLDGKSDDYVVAYYDAAIGTAASTTPALTQARLDASPAPSTTPAPNANDPEAARKRMQQESRDAWKVKAS